MTAGRSRTLRHRCARLLTLVAFVIFQPLATFHFATDEAHIANTATSIQVATDISRTQDHARRGAGGHPRPDQPDPPCEFCLLAGAALAQPRAATLVAVAVSRTADVVAVETFLSQKPLTVGHPVRAPPLA